MRQLRPCPIVLSGLMAVHGTPLPNEGRISGRISFDGYEKTGYAAGKPAFFIWPLRQTPHMESRRACNAPLGRSHRAATGKSRLNAAIEATREVLGIPANYRIGIVPASDTGAVEMALWSLIGRTCG